MIYGFQPSCPPVSIITEESYTSQSIALDRDESPKYGEEQPLFKGKKLAMGLDKMGKN
jgi:hypothetical protein